MNPFVFSLFILMLCCSALAQTTAGCGSSLTQFNKCVKSQEGKCAAGGFCEECVSEMASYTLCGCQHSLSEFTECIGICTYAGICAAKQTSDSSLDCSKEVNAFSQCVQGAAKSYDNEAVTKFVSSAAKVIENIKTFSHLSTNSNQLI